MNSIFAGYFSRYSSHALFSISLCVIGQLSFIVVLFFCKFKIAVLLKLLVCFVVLFTVSLHYGYGCIIQNIFEILSSLKSQNNKNKRKTLAERSQFVHICYQYSLTFRYLVSTLCTNNRYTCSRLNAAVTFFVEICPDQ
jgi:hypothetical protein